MSRQDVSDELLTLLGAGHETTASTLGWAFERLRRHPDVLAKLVEEDDEGGNEFRQATIQELQRNRTVIDFSGRHVQAPHFDLGEWRIPHGYTVMIAIANVHANADVFPNPERFDPIPLRRHQDADSLGAVRRGNASLHRSRVRQCRDGCGAANGVAALRDRDRRRPGREDPFPGHRLHAKGRRPHRRASPRGNSLLGRPRPPRASAASSPAAGSGTCTRSGSARDSPGARARLPRSRSPASPR